MIARTQKLDHNQQEIKDRVVVKGMEWKASLDINHVDSNNNKSISAGRAFTRMFKQIEKVYKRLSWVAKAGFCVQETCGLRVK